jgi:hypothetical protein
MKNTFLKRFSPSQAYRAFSLVEVVIAIGIISIAGLAIIGVLSAGFNSNHNALGRGNGILTLGIVANSLRAASTTDHVTYTAAAPLNMSWSIGNPFSTTQFLFTDSGTFTSSPAQAQQVVSVRITPPQTPNQPCLALIIVAWPSTSKVSWTGSTPTVTNDQGYEFLYAYLNIE